MSEIQIYTSQSIEEMLSTKKKDFLKLIGESNFTRELAFAAQAINSNKLLQQASKNSILQSVYNIGLTGLSLNPIMKFAALTPRWSSQNNGWECILFPQYQGLVKLITDTGSLKSVYAHNVYEGDEFDVILGTSTEVIHKPKFLSKVITHSYAVGILPDGSKQIEVMNKVELDEIKGCSDSYKAYLSGKAKQAIWVTWEGEMCRKTVVKRLTKYLPKTDIQKWEKVNEAIEIDNADYPASNEQINYVLYMVNNSTFDDDQKAQIETAAVSGMTKSDAEHFIKKLEPNQIQNKDRIGMGLMYNQGDIKATMKIMKEKESV